MRSTDFTFSFSGVNIIAPLIILGLGGYPAISTLSPVSLIFLYYFPHFQFALVGVKLSTLQWKAYTSTGLSLFILIIEPQKHQSNR